MWDCFLPTNAALKEMVSNKIRHLFIIQYITPITLGNW